MKDKFTRLLGGLERIKQKVSKLHKEGPFRIHIKLHKYRWYAHWHKHPHHKKVHVAILAVYIFSVLSTSLFLPTQTQAALTTRTITKSSLAEFAQGSLDDLLNENDSLSMHLGKKVNTGNSSTSEELNSYSGRSITRTSDGRIHIVWLKKEVAPKIIYHSSSVDEGSTWEVPNEVATEQNASGVLTKLDGSNNVHIFWAVANPGKTLIKHRIKGSDGFFGAIRVVPTNELDGAVADWQAIPQGDHYGNYYDTVSGGLATVIRTTSKTIYNPSAGKIYDVPAGYLGIRPRSDGNLGYEAEIEEGRTNYLLNTDSSQMASAWGAYGTSAALTKSLVTNEIIRTNVLRLQYVGLAGDTNATLVAYTNPAVGTFAAGENAAISIYIKGSTSGTTSVLLKASARDASQVHQGEVQQAVSLTSSFNRVTLNYPNLPTNTSIVRLSLEFRGIDLNDIVDVSVAAPQAEKGLAATSYIPTTTAASARNADVVSTPTTNWNQNTGTVFSVAKRNDSANTNNDYFSIFNNTSDRIFMRNDFGDTDFLLSTYDGSGSSNANSPVVSGQMIQNHVAAASWSASAVTKAYYNGVGGAPGSASRLFTLLSTANLGCTPAQALYFNGSISRFVIFATALSDAEINSRSNSLLAGTEEALLRNPVADWHAIQQGDHYGNYYDSVTGGLATVTRNTPKTIYDPTMKKIYDVPVNYLGVRPRPDGTLGYEAEIEEGRTNYLTNSNGSQNAGGAWSNWGFGTLAGTPTKSLVSGVYGETAQRIQYTGLAGDNIVGFEFFSPSTAVSSFASGESGTASVWIKGSASGVSLSLRIRCRAADDSYISPDIISSPITLTGEWQRVVLTGTMNTGTSRARLLVNVASIAEGDSFDFTVSATQLEKGAFATSYIPTTTASVARSADSVTVPTTNWNPTIGTVLSHAGTPGDTTVRRIFSWYASNDNRMSIYTTGGTSNALLYSQGASQIAVGTELNTKVSAMSWAAGENLSIYSDGVRHPSPGTVGIPVGLPATASIGNQTNGNYFNGPISQLVAYSVALNDVNIANIGNKITSLNSLSNTLPVPSVDISNSIHFLYDKNGAGIAYRLWNGSSWNSPGSSVVVSGVSAHTNSNTLSIDSNLYYFYTLTSDRKRYLVKRTNGIWGSPLLVSGFTSTDSNEIVDSDGNIQIFTTDESLSDTILKYRKYNVLGNAFTNWDNLDSQALVDVNNPSATISSNGNIWIYYNVGTVIYYKIFNKITGLFGNRTEFHIDSPAFYPKVRYQENFHYFPDKIDILYRQNPTGDSSSYNLYYGTVGSDTTGTYTSPETGENVLSTNWIGGWGEPALTSNVNIPDGTAINYEIRTGNGPDKNTVSWGGWVQTARVDSSTGTGDRLFSVASADMPTLNLGTEKYLQIRISLISENGSNVPILYDYSLNYLADENAPTWTLPEAVSAYTDATKTTLITSGTWDGKNTSANIYLDWSGAQEPVGESGISDYYVYFGTDNTANPKTAGVDKNLVTEGLLTIATPISGQTYFLRVTVCDVAGNCTETPSGQPLFDYRFDSEKPIAPTNYSVSPIGWSTENSFTFSWEAAIDPGSGASEVKGYEYKRAGGGDNWTFVAAAPSIAISNVTSYQDGSNDFYIRSVDNAGNSSGDTTDKWTVIHYYYNGSSPSKPTNLTVNPQARTTNGFTFSWEEPANHNAPIKGYYYSVNSVPNANNTVYTTETTTGQIPAATQQGLNTFYVVAIDDNDKIGWSNYEEIQFECNTTAPGIPGGVVVSDSSNMIATDWALTTKWQVPSTGSVDHYAVYRSTDGNNYSKVAETASTGYLDSGLSNTSNYSYKITAVDNAGAESGFSSVVSKQPTGKFAQAPIILDGPEISAKATNTVISWTTDRPSSSFVAFGKTADNLNDSKGQLDAVTSHSVTLWGLDPGTTYYYKVQSFDENRDYPTSEAFSNVYNFKTQAAPAIEDVDVSDVGLYSAVITWKTTSSATSKIIYGKTGTYDRSIEDKSGSQTTIHTVQLEDLDHSSSYNFKILGTDVDENKLESDNYFFQTLVYPKVSNVRFEQQKNTATATIKVTWDSNVPLTSVVEHKEASAAIFKETSSSKLTSKHELSVAGLKDNTDYLVQVQGRDAHGNLAVSDVNKVRTNFDTRPPEVYDITTESSIVGYGTDAKAQVILSWESDEPSTSQVVYEKGTGGDAHSFKTQTDSSLATTHVVVISGLSPSTVYHFHAVSKDGSGNETTSEETSLLTDQASSSVLDIIINSLENSLGWLFRVLGRN